MTRAGGPSPVDHAARLHEALGRLFGKVDGGLGEVDGGLGAVHDGVGGVDDGFEQEVARAAEVRHVAAGEVLVREGEAGDAAYVVLSGRLRAVAGPPDRERELSEARAGQTVGELALLTGAPRSATVFAARDSVVARIATADFEALLGRHPTAALAVSRVIAERLRRLTETPTPTPPGTVTVAVLPVGPADAPAFATALAAAIDPMLSSTVVAAADAPPVDDAAALAAALDAREEASPAVVYAGERGWTPWNDAILRRADEVLLVAEALHDPGPGALEAAVFAPRERRGPRITLVLRQPAGREPSGTARWLVARPGASHLHVRADDPGELARVARWVTGRSVGLVLGGGGARGWAHVGAMQALLEAGVPVDLVGGTSQGALVGSAIADRRTPDEIRRLAKGYIERVRDYTPPVVSLLRGRRILRGIRHGAREGADIEDLWLPYFAVATNLSRAEPLVIDRGPVVDAVRASVSLPLVLPPVIRDGDVIVDGGLLDNLPIGPMRRRMRTGAIVAIDPSPPRPHAPADPMEPDVSGWRLLADRVRGRRRSGPGIGEIAMRTLLAGTIHLRRRGEGLDPDVLLLVPEIGDWPLLDFGSLETIADLGYRELREPIRAWWALRHDRPA